MRCGSIEKIREGKGRKGKRFYIPKARADKQKIRSHKRRREGGASVTPAYKSRKKKVQNYAPS